uniref:Adenosine deaminase domain-containing protein n=1 Tax=Fabrea salina TaxID=342563 RepID=A0A7S3I9Q9_9CILI|mmetsp:Transcript_2106/g.3362  ORF Transcript_2106/g.3362 Transcript_2106/m.3362 type:complete len:354 (+) Transcript_2106:362-1423(+)
METFIGLLPKAELHVHIEGCMEPSLVLKLAQRNQVDFPYTLSELTERRNCIKDFRSFAEEFYLACSVLLQEEDFYDLAMEYFSRCSAENVKYCEVFVNTAIHSRRGLTHNQVMAGLQRAAQQAKREYGLEAKWILTLIKDCPVQENLEMIHQAALNPLNILGIGLAGPEEGYCSEMAELIKTAKDLGLCGPKGVNVTAHAGEVGSPYYVIDAVSSLLARRIDHGVRSFEDPCLMEFLKTCRIPVTSCPLSNVALKVLDRFCEGKHIVRKFLESGVCVSVHSDDPAFFGGYILANFYKILQEDFADLSTQELEHCFTELCANSFKSAFLDSEQKDHYVSEVYNVAKLNRHILYD